MEQYITAIKKYLQELRIYANEDDISEQNISTASVYRHIDHMLKASEMMVLGIQFNDTPQPKFNPVFSVVMLFQRLPRGVAKSPAGTYTDGDITQDMVLNQLDSFELLIIQYKDISNGWWTHPDFGDISGTNTLKFCTIHIHHHLKIIRDIKKQSK